MLTHSNFGASESETVLLHFVCRDRTRNTGYIACRVCLEDFQTSINCEFV